MKNNIHIHLYGKCYVPLGWHMDKNFAVNRLYVFYSGKGYYKLNDKIYDFESGYLYLLPSNLDISLINDSDDHLMHLFFDFLIFPNITANEPIKLKLSDYPILQSYVNVFLTLFKTYDVKNNLGSFEPITGFVNTLKQELDNVLFYINQIHPLHQLPDTRINIAISYILKHYAENITVEQLAKLTHTETNHFIKVFKKTTSKTPYQYMKDYRHSLAVSMLKDGMRPSEIATKVGYDSIYSFSNAIKKQFGKSPIQLQQELLKSQLPNQDSTSLN